VLRKHARPARNANSCPSFRVAADPRRLAPSGAPGLGPELYPRSSAVRTEFTLFPSDRRCRVHSKCRVVVPDPPQGYPLGRQSQTEARSPLTPGGVGQASRTLGSAVPGGQPRRMTHRQPAWVMDSATGHSRPPAAGRSRSRRVRRSCRRGKRPTGGQDLSPGWRLPSRP